MKRLLITGASGLLGWSLCRLACGEWEVVGTMSTHVVAVSGVRMLRVDLTSAPDVTALFRDLRPQAVIHAAAVSSPNVCQTHPVESARINVETSILVASLCAEAHIPCLFTSTDLVFDGLDPPYKEDHGTSPVNVYGIQKVRAEEGMMARYPGVTVCRMPLMFGDSGPSASSFIQPMVSAMREGRTLTLFTDEFRTPVSAADAATGLLMALRIGVAGILHLGGSERISRYDFGKLLARTLGMQGARLVPCLRQDIPMAAPRPQDVSLDSSKAFAMGYRPAPLESSLRELAARM